MNCRIFVSNCVGKTSSIAVMASASQQIAGGDKKTRTKVPKVCGAPNCRQEAAGGAKLRISALETESLYPHANEGKLSTCKAHRVCVGFVGYSPDLAHGSGVTVASCSAPAKIVYLGRAFCEGCHNTYLEALVALMKPRLTTAQVMEVRKKVVEDNVRELDAEDAEIAEMEAKAKALKAAKSARAKAAAKAAAGTPAPAPKGKGKAATAAKGVKSKAAAPVVEDEDEEDEASDDQVETEDETPVAAPSKAKAVKAKPAPAAPSDPLEELEDEDEVPDKAERARSAVSQASPTGPVASPDATIVSDPLKAAAAKVKRAAAKV
jgi:hypothetical protein